MVRGRRLRDPNAPADVIAHAVAAQTGSDRDSVMSTLAPEMMQLPTGRLAEPQEIADAFLLASPRSASTTGTEIIVDSGLIKTI